jgi:GNAT superfamily N-acetyltransferase
VIQTQLRQQAAALPRRPAALPDGIQIRPASAQDREAMISFVTGLSLRTQSLRFFAAMPRPGPGLLRRLCGGGDNSPDVLVATENGAIIGHAMAADRARPDGRRVADIGLVVTDSWQDHGIGRRMLQKLIERAAGRGVTELVMDVKPDNRKMLAMIGRRWPAARYQTAGDAITIRVALPRTDRQPAEPHLGQLPGQPA